MKKSFLVLSFLSIGLLASTQTNPAITAWLRNNTGITGRHYLQGNPTPINDNVLANVQSVQYSATWVYVKATGIPTYITGPFLDGNPSLASEQTGYFKFPLNPVENAGTPTATTGGNIGAFINGVALFDYRDGVAWNSTTNAPCGGPGNPPCPGGPMATQNWNRDAVLAERNGFDCAKAHPAMGNYHHHQNPSAFDLDLVEISNVCDLYPADGLYAIDPTQHSPLIGFAYDGFPIYGAYAYKNANGTGGIMRMKSSYQLRNITQRTTSPTGVDVPDGPPVSTTYPLGYFREDYEYIVHSESDYLDAHNGRFCVTPEYPNGIYCYFATVDANWNSAYPYVVGPTFYGMKNAVKVQTITESVTTYTGPPLTAGTNVTSVQCFGGATGAINLTVTGGNPPYTFNWGSGITSQNRSGLAAGSYTVTITDATAQTTTQTVTVTQPTAALSATATVSPVACFGETTGAIALTATGGTAGYFYHWNDDSTVQNRSSLASGNYSVTITDANNCTTTVSQTIAQPASAVSATATASPVACFGGNTGAIALTAMGGTPGYTFLWENGSAEPDRTALPAGSYSATISDANGCTNTVSQNIAQPSIALNPIATASPVACFGETSGTIALTATGGTPGYSFLWENGSTGANRTELPAGSYSATVSDANNCTAAISQIVAEPDAALSAVATASQVSCFGETTGTIALTATGGTANYAFVWENGSSEPNRTALAAGNYSATVSDANGCTTSLSETITQPNEIMADATATNATCGEANGAVSLSVNGGTAPYSFVWSNGATLQNPTGLATGTYTVSINDANGCATSNIAQVSNLNGAAASLSVTPIACFGDATASLSLELVGGNPPFTFNWNDGNTEQNRTGLTAGEYFVTIQDASGCVTLASQSITQPAELSVSGTSTPETCNMANGTITLNVVGGIFPYMYAWGNGIPFCGFPCLTAGAYTVTITDVNGCTAQSTIVVEGLSAPEAMATAAPVSCYGGSDGAIAVNISNGTAPYYFAWSNTSTQQNQGGLQAGDYSLTLTDANGCTTSLLQTVAQPSEALSVTSSAADAGCFGDSTGAINLFVAGGTPGYSFHWNNGNTAQDLTGLPAAFYAVTVTDANGCFFNASAAVSQPTALVATTTPTYIACFGNTSGAIDLMVVGGTAPYAFDWSNGQTTEDLVNLPIGNYTATVLDIHGCSFALSQTLTGPAAPLAASTTATAATPAGDGSATASATGGTPPYTFDWSNGFSGDSQDNLAASTYLVTITDANGCTATGSATVDLTNASTVVLGDVKLNVFPNPASDIINIQAKGLLRNNLHLKLANASGQVLLENDMYAGSTISYFDTRTLYDGVYFLTVTDGMVAKAFKLVVSK